MLPGWFARLPLPTVLKHFAGSAWLMAGRLVAMGAVAGFGLAVYVGLMSAIDSVTQSRDAAYRASQLADLELRVVADDVANFPDFSKLEGVADHRLRMVYPGSASIGGRTISMLVIAEAGKSATPINRQELIDGRPLDPADRDGVLIERSLAQFHQLAPGSTLEVKLGKERLSLHVRGVVTDGEFLLAPANPALFVPSKGTLGIVYAQAGVFSDRYGFMPANSVLLRASPGADLDQLRQRVIERAQQRLNVDGTALMREQFSHQFLEKNLGVFRIIVPVIVLVSVLSAALVTSFLFAQWLQAERQHLAVLLALGHPMSWLASGFAAMALYLGVGVLAGGLPSAWWVGQGFLDNFAGALGMPTPALQLGTGHAVAGSLGVLAVFALSGLVAWRRLAGLSPRDAMRLAPAVSGSPGRLSGVVGRWLPASWLGIPLRALLRHGGTTGITVLATALGFGLTSAFFISYSSFVGTSVKMVEANTWDLAVDFNAPLWTEDLVRFKRDTGLGDAELSPYTKLLAQAVSADGRQRANLYAGGFDPQRPWHATRMTAGQPLAASDPQGILIEDSTARQLGLGVGAPLSLDILGKRWPAHVRGLFSGGLPGEARLTLAYAQEISDMTGRITGVFVQRPPAAIEVSARQLQAHPDVRQVLTRPEVAHEILQASGQISTIIHMGSMLSVAVAALFVFASTGYTVMRQAHEFQALRLLGFRDSRVALMIVVQIALIGLVALLLSVPVGSLVAHHLLDRLSASWFRVDTIVSLRDYLQSAVLGAVLLPLVAVPLSRAVLRVPLATELRTREVG